MEKILFLVISMFCLSSCSQSRMVEGVYLDKENENIPLSIKKENGKYWLHFFEEPAELFQNDNEVYFQIRNQKYTVTIDKKNDIIDVLGHQFIPVSKTMKGQFAGKWVNDSEDTAFLVQLDDSALLTWDIIKGTGKPIRFYPKRTETGFHFSYNHDILSYVLEDGVLIDANGVKYKKQGDLGFVD